MASGQRKRALGEQLDVSNPEVRSWLAEFGTLQNAVSIRLIGVNLSDLELQIQRLERAFGKTIAMATPRRGHGVEWIVYGTITQ